MIAVAVTGGIGSGKSALVEELEHRGAHAIDADRVAWRLLERHEIRESIQYAFGVDVLAENGEIERRRLAALAFRDAESAETLNAILHPPILLEIERWIGAESAKSETPVALVEASLILEADARSLVDYLVLITAPLEVRLARLAARGVSRENALARSRLQWPDEEKAPFADFVVSNDGTREELASSSARLWKTLIALPPRDSAERGRSRKDGSHDV